MVLLPGLSAMSVHPTISLLHYFEHVGPAHLRSEQFKASLADFVAAGAGQERPEVGLLQILGNASSHPVAGSEYGLRADVAVVGCASKPLRGLLVVARNVAAVRILGSKGKLCRRITAICQQS